LNLNLLNPELIEVPLTRRTFSSSFSKQNPPSYDALMIALTEESGKLDEQYDIIHKKSHVIGEQQKQINILEEQRRLLRQQRYGKSREKNAAQGELFNEVEQLADQPEPEDIDAESSTDQPKKKKKGRTGLSPDLPREKILLRLTDE